MSFLNQIGQGAVYAMGDLAKHHSHDSNVNINGLTFLVREIVHDAWGHDIELLILGSPEGKLNGYSSGTHRGHHAHAARDECLTVLKYQVSQTYGK